MQTAETTLAQEIAATLRGIVHVPRQNPGSLVARREFWQRCRLLNPDWRSCSPRRIFVDGFHGACHWNAWKVYTDALEPGLSLWMGYALHGGSWTEHSWCMLGDRIVETTWPFRIYFGAELTPEERGVFGGRYGKFDLAARVNVRVMTFVDGFREDILYDANTHADGIGRERDVDTGEIKPGLGR
jgi:hypothetical protein